MGRTAKLARVASARVSTVGPMSVPGCVLWLDANTGVSTAGSVITSWTDRSGLGNTGTPSGSPTLTASAINGLSAATFVKASSQFISLPNKFGAYTSAEIFIVCTSTGTTVALHNFGNSVGTQQLYP